MCFDICVSNIRVGIRVRGLHLLFKWMEKPSKTGRFLVDVLAFSNQIRGHPKMCTLMIHESMLRSWLVMVGGMAVIHTGGKPLKAFGGFFHFKTLPCQFEAIWHCFAVLVVASDRVPLCILIVVG